jgi:hypothetical protein
VTVTPARIVLVVLATARLTRFITRDWVGEWTIVRPVKSWASSHERRELERRSEVLRARREVEFDRLVHDDADVFPPYSEHDPFTWQAKLATGLDCPFCVGFWVGGAVIAGEAITGASRAPRVLRAAWSGILAALALNYLVGHLSHRLDRGV